jgi:hypothetical protein
MKWVDCKEQIPELKDDCVLVYFSETEAIETVHIEDYFGDITAGFDGDGNQLYTKWYLTQKITHWMPLPEPPNAK